MWMNSAAWEAFCLPWGSDDNPKPASACPDGWVFGDEKGPKISLIFKYTNKQDVLIATTASTVVCAY